MTESAFDIAPELVPQPDYIEVEGLRPYQCDGLRAVHDGWQDEGCSRQLVVKATGTGKTVLMGAIAKTFAKSNQRTLMLAHTEELLDQARDKFAKRSGIAAGLEKASDRASLHDEVVVASVQTMRGFERLQSWPRDHFGLVMIDEAHRTMAKSYLTVLSHFDNARVIGVTATADRGDKQALGRFYQRIAFEYGMVDAINDGWLVQVEIQPISVKIDLNGIGTKRNTDGDVDLDAKMVSHRIEPFLGDIAREIRAHASTRRILGFTPSIDIAQKMVEVCQRAGFKAVDWVAGVDKERTRKIAAFKRGEIQLLWNAMLLTEGFDQDDIDTIVNLRATDVRALYQQMIGRGTRPLEHLVKYPHSPLNVAPDAAARRAIIAASAKPHVLVLDPLWLHETHNLAEPASLVSRNEEEMKLMKGKQGNLLNIQAVASRDLMDSLREKILKNANRRVARINPFTFGVVLGHEELALYQPETLWDARQPTIEQLKALVENGIEAEEVKWRGQAAKILKVIDERRERGLCSIRLMNWLRRHDIAAELMTHEQATKHQRRLFGTGFR